jgi:hypothetical protein
MPCGGLDRGKTVVKPLALSRLGLPLSEKQIPQVIEKLESGVKPKELLERVVMRPRQVRYQAALRPDFCCSLILAYARVLDWLTGATLPSDIGTI